MSKPRPYRVRGVRFLSAISTGELNATNEFSLLPICLEHRTATLSSIPIALGGELACLTNITRNINKLLAALGTGSIAKQTAPQVVACCTMHLVHIAFAAQPRIRDFQNPHVHVSAWMRSSIDQEVPLVIVKSFIGPHGIRPVDIFRSWLFTPWPLSL